jgi:hypothetical protein
LLSGDDDALAWSILLQEQTALSAGGFHETALPELNLVSIAEEPRDNEAGSSAE